MKSTIVTFLFLLGATVMFADSPITSTNFYVGYKSNDVIRVAKKEGTISSKMCAMLSNPDTSIDFKVALINALSWDIDGKDNYDIYWEYLISKYGKSNLMVTDLVGDEVLCLAYLKVMDNYNVTKDAMRLASYAVRKKKNSYTYQMIYSLIRAQDTFNRSSSSESWCRVYQVVAAVEQDENLTRDMNQIAIDEIFKYIDLYKDSCIDTAVKEDVVPVKQTAEQRKQRLDDIRSKKNRPQQAQKEKVTKKKAIDQ